MKNHCTTNDMKNNIDIRKKYFQHILKKISFLQAAFILFVYICNSICLTIWKRVWTHTNPSLYHIYTTSREVRSLLHTSIRMCVRVSVGTPAHKYSLYSNADTHTHIQTKDGVRMVMTLIELKLNKTCIKSLQIFTIH